MLEVRAEASDNWRMVHDAPTGPEGSGPGLEPGGPSDAVRERYLRVVLDQFEAGRIEPYDYTRRVMAIDAAASTAQMAAIVDQPPDTASTATTPSASPALDAVDLALLRQHQQHAGTAPGTRTRYTALVAVVLVFVVLIVMGVWLASRAHAVGPTPGATILGVVASGVPG